MKKLLIATNNPGKISEISDLLQSLPLQLLTPNDLGIILDVDETGGTYGENARIKAVAFMKASGLASLADDTGLEVAALNGAPGLHSKRYAPKPDATDADRRRLLQKNLQKYPHPWSARFICSVALALPDGRMQDVQGTCEGEIIPEERGTQGFGYDRIFYFTDLGKTMAELDMSDKNRISHRARAVNNILPALKSYLDEMVQNCRLG
jgi:XTP/dITP diphosphohydrolase